MARKLGVIVLAAGEGKRMHSPVAKVLHPVCGRPMLDRVLDAAAGLTPGETVVVVSPLRPEVKTHAEGRGFRTEIQKRPLGTGDAVRAGLAGLRTADDILVVCGDTPLLDTGTLREFVRFHHSSEAAISVLTANVESPTGYGRVIRGPGGDVERIAEEKDATRDEKAVREINSGVYVFGRKDLARWIAGLRPANSQNEYYLTDTVGLARGEHSRIAAWKIETAARVKGVNTQAERREAEAWLYEWTIGKLMAAGVVVDAGVSPRVDPEAAVAPGAELGSGVEIRSGSVVGKGTRIDTGSIIESSSVGAGTHIKPYSVLSGSEVGKECEIGPFARLRPGSRIGDGCKIGNFVETKKSVFGKGSKASHLAYIGDAKIGKNVNLGCGTITCNYDGYQKHETVIGDDVFIGSDSQLVAPVTVGRGAYVASGSTITENVPADALAIARSRQAVKPGRAKALRKRLSAGTRPRKAKK
ncbi:MAG: bifunctional UDP-N-acetylglucosamine diphosphorylase/glucosamine-1-phosphate N-acetyltransferase GlmU [Deltaproteobacteria bacterium]|nr:bifunctional UDP-N-acetylglucosamine diphosphorylase/glucosamine-1-phosphate N-acetyltransferase GlmU [Deltaproteobacteria bacterium]